MYVLEGGLLVFGIASAVQYLTRVEDRDAHFEARNRYRGDHAPTSARQDR